jgi:1-acyl-sn-glycerol-3-phosphate acyltransferase
MLKIFFGLEVKGRENIPKKGGFIVAGNHVSYLDPIVLGVASPRRLYFMAKQELFVKPFFSWGLLAVGAFPVKRDSADLSAIKQAIHRVRQGNGLALFPEGSRRFDGVHMEPYAGIGFLAAKLNVPVVPVFIRGTEIALPKNAKFIRPAKVTLCFGKQISIERRMPYQDIAQLIMENIRHLSC